MILDVQEVTKRYETGGETIVALNRIDLQINPGEFIAVIGPSGSGKSTLLNILGLLDVPSEGTVRLDGTDVGTMNDTERTRARKRTIGFVFQDFYLIPTLTAQENVELPRMFDGKPGETADRAEDLLERVGLGDRTGHHPNELSGGQKQRVAIARSLINEPRVLLADEPTGNLDQDTGGQILDEFEAVTNDDVAVVAVTHDEQVTGFADRVIELIDGKIRGQIDPDEEVVDHAT